MRVCWSSPARVLLGLAVLTIAGAQARATDLRQLMAHPRDFVAKQVVLSPAFCGGGGQQGAEPELTQCSIAKGDVYVESRAVAPIGRARDMQQNCGGLDVWEQSSFCRFTVKFTLQGFHPSNDIDAKKPVLLLETDSLEID